MRGKGTFMLRIRLGIVIMNIEVMVKGIAECRPIVVRRIGRPRLRGVDDVIQDVGRMKFQNWNKLVMDVEAWKRIVDQTKAH
jgi:hypothetical protein